MPSYRALAFLERYRMLTNDRQPGLWANQGAEEILFNYPFNKAVEYLDHLFLFLRPERAYFGLSVYYPLLALAARRLSGKRPLIRMNKRAHQMHYLVLDDFMGYKIPNNECPSLAALVIQSTRAELEVLKRVSKIYGRQSLRWMRKTLYFNRAVETLDYLSCNPQPADQFPPETQSLIPYASLRGYPNINELRRRWRKHIRANKRHEISFKETITTYERSKLQYG